MTKANSTSEKQLRGSNKLLNLQSSAGALYLWYLHSPYHGTSWVSEALRVWWSSPRHSNKRSSGVPHLGTAIRDTEVMSSILLSDLASRGHQTITVCFLSGSRSCQPGCNNFAVLKAERGPNDLLACTVPGTARAGCIRSAWGYLGSVLAFDFPFMKSLESHFLCLHVNNGFVSTHAD